MNIARMKPGRVLRHAAIGVLLLWILLPLVYLFMTSVKPGSLLLEVPPRLWFTPTADNYDKVLQAESLLKYVGNSLLVAILSTLGSVVLGSMAAFAFVHFSFRFKKGILFGVLMTRMFPPVTTLIPISIAIGRMGLTDTRTALVLPYIAFQIPIVLWIMMDFIRQIPRELQESALIDGCSTFGLFWRIVMPLAAPGLIASGILAFIYNWNELLFALVLTSVDAKTLPVALIAYTESEGMLQWGSVSVLGMVTLLPVLVFFLALNRFLVQGLMAGAVKG
ncbi:MAG TPA: carbohydrate ABC transporter permease [Ramlibacter sp.]|uniref:carbohydrate ABC transporter permease n=1 Tax=Ramlibacter sp. TaxID=1917967 RepID=UPI002B8A8B35|nr:carbohydrate ABC transporter permease [Ramlibacter sp.]HVZ43531.1 carbohydrate ABC transporter permease [Ramlibacter sp.]